MAGMTRKPWVLAAILVLWLVAAVGAAAVLDRDAGATLRAERVENPWHRLGPPPENAGELHYAWRCGPNGDRIYTAYWNRTSYHSGDAVALAVSPQGCIR